MFGEVLRLYPWHEKRSALAVSKTTTRTLGLVFFRIDKKDPETYRGLTQGCALEILVADNNRYALKYPLEGIELTDKLDALELTRMNRLRPDNHTRRLVRDTHSKRVRNLNHEEVELAMAHWDNERA